MKFFAVLLLAGAALSGGAEECSERKAETCVETLLASLLGDTTEEEVCAELRSSIDCLRSAASNCLEQQQAGEVEEGLKELEDLARENCASQEPETQDNDEKDKEMELCVNSNEDYFYQCVYEGSTQAFSTLLEQGDVGENELKCSMYSFMADCFVERLRERCGQEASRIAKEEFEDAPSEIKEACEELTLHSLQLLDVK